MWQLAIYLVELNIDNLKKEIKKDISTRVLKALPCTIHFISLLSVAISSVYTGDTGNISSEKIIVKL